MLRFLVMLLGGLLLPLLAAAQSADEIPEALLAESDAVVRLDETETTYTSPTNVADHDSPAVGRPQGVLHLCRGPQQRAEELCGNGA